MQRLGLCSYFEKKKLHPLCPSVTDSQSSKSVCGLSESFANEGHGDVAIGFAHIFNICPCKLCKPDALNFYGHRDCYLDCCQGQFRSERKRFESDLANGHILTVLNLF
jgi:hypothetical protein